MARLKTTDDEHNFEGFIEALFNLNDSNQVIEELSSLDIPQPYKLRIKILYSNIGVGTILDSQVDKNNLKFLNRESNTYLFQPIIYRTLDFPESTPVLIVNFKANGVPESIQAIISVCKLDRWKLLLKFLKKQYPKIVPILLSQGELINSAKRLKKVVGHTVYVTDYGAKEEFSTRNKRKQSKSIRVWTGEDLDKALATVQERGQTLTSLHIQFHHQIGSYSNIFPKASCKIKKTGEVEAVGSFKIAFHEVALDIAKSGYEKLKFLSNRGLRNTEYKPRPIAIDFCSNIFREVGKIREFVKILSKYPKSMHAVLHGNPYAHIKISDTFDGSSFDVWATSSSRIAIIPGLKATEAAFERIIHYIFDKFNEGQISEYERDGRIFEAGTC